VGGFFGWQYWQRSQASNTSAYETVKVSRGDLQSLVGATGTVRSNQNTLVAWQTSGRIGEIAVKLDQKIKKGDLLAELDSSTLPQQVILARSDLITANKNLDDLKKSDLARANAQLALANAKKLLDDKQKARENKQYKRASLNAIDSARANYILSVEAVKNAEENYNLVSLLPDDDARRAGPLSQLAAARTTRDRALASMNYLLSHPDAIEISQADGELAVATAKLKDAEREWERVKNGASADDIKAAEARVEAIKATLDTVNLEAPFDATVTDIRSMVGDQVSPGTISFRLDDLTHLLVDVQVTEVDINRVQEGQPATMTFDAILGKEYKGKVTEVARIGTSQQGVVNFDVTVELTDTDLDVHPGMTAAVNVITSQLSNILLVPNRAVRLRDGQRVVYVLQNNALKAVPVKIGASSDTMSELVSDEIKEGDLLVLNPPAEVRFGPPGGMR
jgi:HlyD family secretion protein